MNAINNPIQQGKNAADSQAIEMFNAKFTNYEGKGQSIDVVRSLFSVVAANNAVDSNHYVNLYYQGLRMCWNIFYGFYSE